ncbi:hypothetical protein BC835DRAFT_1415979 [Cytidiella melzeri]|nr:hypothetical protein BC835DRAFT_1415979 [Cytidiella melzeri]
MISPTYLYFFTCLQLAVAAATPVLHRSLEERLVVDDSDEPVHDGLDTRWVIVIIVLVVLVVSGVVGTCVWSKLRQRRSLKHSAIRHMPSTPDTFQEKSVSPNSFARQSPIPEPIAALKYDGPYRGFASPSPSR